MSGFTYKTGVLGILMAVYALTGSLYAQDQGDSDGSSTNETAAEQASSEDPRAARMREINQAWIERIHEDGQANPDSPASNSAGEQDSADSAAQSDTDSGNVNLANPGEEQDGGGLFTDDEAPSFFGVVFRFFGMMALMVALFYVAVRYIRKRAGGAFVSGNNDLVELVVSVPLVQGKFLQIVDVAGKLMVLGVSDAGVQMLSTVDDGITADRIRMWQSERGTVSVPDDLLTRITDMFKSADFRFWNHEGREDQNKKANFGEILRKQLPPDSVAAEQASAQRNGRRNVNQPDLIPNTDAEDAIDSPDDGADLKKLLRQQKKRLATLRKNNDA